MKIGVSCPPEYWHLLKAIGFDFAEGNFTSTALAEESEFCVLCEQREAAGLDVEAFNCFFPSRITLYENDWKETAVSLRQFAEKGFERANILGGKIAVIGSGKSRSIPSGMNPKDAEARFLSILSLLGEMAEKADMRIAIEPLSFTETNLINTVFDGYDFAVKTGCKNVGTMIDFYHAFTVGDSLHSLPIAKEKLFHVHIARPNLDRKVPTEADREACIRYARALKSINYDGRISLEAVFDKDIEKDFRNTYPLMQLFREG